MRRGRASCSRSSTGISSAGPGSGSWDSELPLTRGAVGPAVADLQRRLLRQGFPVANEEAWFGPATEHAVHMFQEQRGLDPSGICDRDTWARLVEAGYRLGDRMLYWRAPMLRGDDVADLQKRLNALGFDAGRTDGMFGPDTDRALRGFQRNAGLLVDGHCGFKTVQSLHRLRSKGPDSDPNALRESVRLSATPNTLRGLRVALGEFGGMGAFLRELQHTLSADAAVVTLLSHPDPSILAAQANMSASEVFIGISMAPTGRACRAAYYGAHGTVSPAGRRLAGMVVDELSINGAGTDGPPTAMATPILRETRMPAIALELGPPRFVVESAPVAAAAVARGLARWADGPCLDVP